MKEATPNLIYELLPPPENKEERIRLLHIIEEQHKGFLEKADVLLPQLKRAGIGIHNIKEQDIRGLSHEDVCMVFDLIHLVYAIFKVNYNLKIGGRGSKKKEDFFIEGGVLNHNIFYVSGFDTTGETREVTFKVGRQFELALKEIREVLDNKNRYLNLKNDLFFYNGHQLKIKPETLFYEILRNVFNFFNGKSGERQYKELFEELRKIKKLKRWSDYKLKEKIRQELTSKSMGLGRKIKAVENNGQKLFETQGDKITFNNQKISE
jgi:hypothetical protein